MSAPTIDEQAIAWLVEREEGFGPGRADALAAWLRADARHAEAFARLAPALDVLGAMPEFRAEVEAAWRDGEPAAPRPRAARWPAWAALGGLAAALALGFFLFNRAGGDDGRRFATAPESRERVQLGDGSALELNAASAVRVTYTAAERRVELEEGEAHFAVAKDAARPFVVRAGGVSVRAVGTAFNVRRAHGAVEVVVIEGRVEVAGAQGGAAPLVSAGERATVATAAAAPRVELIDDAAVQAALAWQERLAEFADEPLRDVIARFNARNRLQLAVADAALGERRIAGTFPLAEPEAFVRLLERDGDIAGERRGPHLIELRRAP
jgi:transmembrane sensor